VSTDFPTAQPVASPTARPSDFPTAQPVASQTARPSDFPTAQPVANPIAIPSVVPSAEPSVSPTLIKPTSQPTSMPTLTRYCPLGSTRDFTQEGLWCVSCAIGTQSSSIYDSECSPCNAGFFCNALGSVTGTPCPINTYSTRGAETCVLCPSGSITAKEGSASQAACVYPMTNFIIGGLTLAAIFPLSYLYLIHGRIHRITYLRSTRVTRNLVSILMGKHEEILLDISSIATPPQSTGSRCKALLFIILGVGILFLFTGLFLLATLLKIFFQGMILHRATPQFLPGSLVILAKAWIQRANFLFPFLKDCFAPFLVLFEALLYFHIDLSSVNLTCDGSLAPLELLFNLLILFFVAIVIESEYCLLLSPIMTSVYREYLTLLSKGSLSVMLAGWWKILLYLVLYIFDPSSLLINTMSYSMTLVSLSKFVSVDGRHGFSTNCNNISPNNYDAFLAYAATVLAYLLFIPAFYTVGKLMIPYNRFKPSSSMASDSPGFCDKFKLLFSWDLLPLTGLFSISSFLALSPFSFSASMTEMDDDEEAIYLKAEFDSPSYWTVSMIALEDSKSKKIEFLSVCLPVRFAITAITVVWNPLSILFSEKSLKSWKKIISNYLRLILRGFGIWPNDDVLFSIVEALELKPFLENGGAGDFLAAFINPRY
jgi:Tyrosine-protein kinase ephrin type A/B receptor-like